MNAQARPAPARTPFWIAVGLVAGREMKVKMSSKAFVVTTAIMLGLPLPWLSLDVLPCRREPELLRRLWSWQLPRGVLCSSEREAAFCGSHLMLK